MQRLISRYERDNPFAKQSATSPSLRHREAGLVRRFWTPPALLAVPALHHSSLYRPHCRLSAVIHV